MKQDTKKYTITEYKEYKEYKDASIRVGIYKLRQKLTIVIFTSSKYAKIYYDTDSIENYIDLLVENKYYLNSCLEEIYNKYRGINSTYDRTFLHGTFYKIPKENSERFASEIYDLFDGIINKNIH